MVYGRLTILLLTSVACCLLGRAAINPPSPEAELPTASPSAFRVAGYLPDYRAAMFDPAAASGLTDIILFSAEPTVAGGLELSRVKNLPLARLRDFKAKTQVRLILCVGGWGHSTCFAGLAGSPQARQEFAKAARQVCLEENFDGLDLDWEHPKNEAEQEGYAKLLEELHQAFKPHGLTLSVTLAPWQQLPRRAFAVVDWIQIMSYDHAGRHSTFEAAQQDVQALIAAGAPREKIILGLPFYGRQVKNREQALAYRNLVANSHPAPETDEVNGLYFNGPATIRRKTEFARAARLGGVMIWELGQDAAGEQSLLKAIQNTVAKPRPPGAGNHPQPSPKPSAGGQP
jgi:GH18 family chitinase